MPEDMTVAAAPNAQLPRLAGLSKADWLTQMERIADAQGYFQPLGPRHWAAFIEGGDTLMVSFETLQGIQALSEEGHPIGMSVSRREGFSQLILLSDGDTWFREELVYAYFDRLIDDGFFDEFEDVLFFGAGPGGYAAAAFSVASPGARVVAVQPQATLTPAIAGWDDRFVEERRRDFTSRYGYAPDMLDAAESACILFDPCEQLDAMHAALFARPGVTLLPMRRQGNALLWDLIEMGLLNKLLALAADGLLDAQVFARLYRARRDYPPYLRKLMAQLESEGRERLLLGLCRNVTARMHAPRFKRRMEALEASL